MLNPKNIWTVAWHEYVTNVRRLGFIIGTLIVPALGAVGLILFLVAGIFLGRTALRALPTPSANGNVPFSTSRPQIIGIVDQSGLFTPIPAEYTSDLRAYLDEESANHALVANEVIAYVVIAKDYVTSGRITAYRKDQSFYSYVDYSPVQSLLVNGLLAGKVDDDTRARVNDPLTLSYVRLDAKGQPIADAPASPITPNDPIAALTRTPLASIVGDPAKFLSIAAGFINAGLFSLLLFMLIFFSGSYLLQSVMGEKESRVIEIVLSSISAAELLAGKVIAYAGLTLTQMAVWLLSGVVLSGGLGAVLLGGAAALNPGAFILGAIYCALGYLIYATLMAALGAGITNLREGQPLLALFLMMPMLSWYPGCFMFLIPGGSNGLLPRVLSYFPFTAATIMTMRLAFGDVPVVDILGSLGVLLLTNVVVLWAGAKVFRASLLMYGKRPSIRQIVRMLKEA